MKKISYPKAAYMLKLDLLCAPPTPPPHPGLTCYKKKSLVVRGLRVLVFLLIFKEIIVSDILDRQDLPANSLLTVLNNESKQTFSEDIVMVNMSGTASFKSSGSFVNCLEQNDV